MSILLVLMFEPETHETEEGVETEALKRSEAEETRPLETETLDSGGPTTESLRSGGLKMEALKTGELKMEALEIGVLKGESLKTGVQEDEPLKTEVLEGEPLKTGVLETNGDPTSLPSKPIKCKLCELSGARLLLSSKSSLKS